VHKEYGKGAEAHVVIYDVGGIGGSYNVALAEKEPAMVSLERLIPVKYTLIGGKHIIQEIGLGRILRLSKRSCEIELKQDLSPLTNIKMNLDDVDEELGGKDFFGKVIEQPGEHQCAHVVRFTAIPPEVSAYFQSHRQHAVKSAES
jgi:adenylate cyclase